MAFSIRKMREKIREAVDEARSNAQDAANSAAEWLDEKFTTRAEKAQATHLKRLTATLETVKADSEALAEELAQTRFRLETEQRTTRHVRDLLAVAEREMNRWRIAFFVATAGVLGLGAYIGATM